MKRLADNLEEIIDHLKNELHAKCNMKDTWLVTLSLNDSKIDRISLQEEAEKLGFQYELNQHLSDHCIVRLWKNKSNPDIGEIIIHSLVTQ